MADAKIIKFPTPAAAQTKPKTCWSCRWASFNDRGTYCLTFGEQIISEIIAASDCDAYEYSDGAS